MYTRILRSFAGAGSKGAPKLRARQTIAESVVGGQ
jgi:hypothetical protein